MNLNHVDYPSSQALVEIMRKVNAYGHEPRVIVELDKFSYVRGLKRKYEVVEFITNTITKNTVSIVGEYDTSGGGTGDDADALFDRNNPVMPIKGKSKLSDMVITSRHRSVNPSRPTHKGLDLDLAIGDPVVAVWGGTVIEAKDNGSYGNEVLIDHGNGIKTRYAHLNSFSVGAGDTVKQGQVIGAGGNTGHVVSSGGDGSHLHFEVIKNGTDINPEPILKGDSSVNVLPSGSAKIVTTYTKGADKVSYDRDFNKTQPYDTKWENLDGEYFSASTPDGAKKMFGFNGIVNTLLPFPPVPGVPVTNSAKLRHTWFNNGYLDFSYYFQKGNPAGIKLKVYMDGKLVWSVGTGMGGSYIGHPAPITVPKGEHTFTFQATAPTADPNAKLGLMTVKCAEFTMVEKQESVTTKTDDTAAPVLSSHIWDYEDVMNNPSKWESHGSVVNGGDYQEIKTGSGIERYGDVKYPFTSQFTVKLSKGAKGNFVVSNGEKAFKVAFSDSATSSGSSSASIDNTQWQDYLVVAKSETEAHLFNQSTGTWEDTGIALTPVADSENKVQFFVSSADSGSMYVDDVKYVGKDFSSSIPTTTTEMKVEDKWYDLGGFVFDETFYFDNDIMTWEVVNHMDMSSATARVTLNNSHGLYSPEYVRDSAFPENLQKNPYSYVEEGEVRHVISEYTPVRIYAGYGEEIVRVFTGMIKGEIEEDSEARTITFNCVDRYDLLEECVLLKDTSFPPEEDEGADGIRRPWIKSSIVQALANHAGMTGWRYVYEDLMHPDLVIEETYFTDINQSNNTFMQFDAQGKLHEVSLGDVKTPQGYKNPFVEDVVFQAGERVSDCIRSVAEEINFRAYVNRYGTFMLQHLDFENNMRWDFKSGENLFSLNTSTDFSRVRNHLIISGASGNTENFFDKDLLIATKGQVRTAKIEAPWIDESNGTTARGAKQVVADKLFFDMKRQARTKNVVVKGNPFIEIMDGCYVYDSNTSTAGYYLIKGNTLSGDENGIVNRLELTWEEKV